MSDVRRDYVRPLLGGADAEDALRGDGGAGARGHATSPSCGAAPTCATAASRFELTVEADDLDAVEERFARGPRAPLRLPDGGRGRRARQRCALIATRAGRAPRAVRARARRATPTRASARPTSTATGRRCRCCGARAWARASRSRARRSSSSPRRPASCGPGWSGAIDAAGTLVLERDVVSLDPVTLSVLASALSGIAEETGALLIRGAYSSNIKERRDCSAALFDAEGRMVAQAEHIPVHLGAMPEAVAAVIERDPAPGRRLDPQRPLPRRHAPARHHARLADRRRRRDHRLRGHARAPLRRRRDAPRLDARRLARHLAGGDRDPAAAARRRRARADPRQRPHARHPPRRPARPDRGQPPRGPAARGARRAARPRRRSSRPSRRSSPTPSGARARRCASVRRRHLRGRARARGRRRHRRGRAHRGRA